MINSAKISIIIPIYDAEKHLKECLDLAINQTLKRYSNNLHKLWLD